MQEQRRTGVAARAVSEVVSPGSDPGVAVEAKPARRTRVENHRSIYFREVAGRRRYEITFYDTQGRRRWRTVPGGLREAKAALEAEHEKTRRGETTAPAVSPRVSEYVQLWLARKVRLRPRTRLVYETNLRLHVVPRLGRLRIGDLRTDDVARVVREMEAAGKSGATIQNVLVALGGMLGSAVRDGLLASNPVRRLESDERPRVARQEMRALDGDEIERLLAAAHPSYRPILATAAFTGLRQGELLGLLWQDVDFEAGLVHVRRQFDRTLSYSEPKTEQSKRSVMLVASLSKLLKAHRLASRFSADTDPVFASRSGTPLAWRNVARRGMDAAVVKAGLDAVPGRRRPTFHDLRDTFASMLIGQGEDVVFVSRQLGHARPSITLDTYADLFDRARHTDRARAAMEAAVGKHLEPRGGDRRRTAERTESPITALAAVSSTGGDS